MTSLWLTEGSAGPGAAPLPDRCDVAVLGGGIAGTSVALHLAERGAEVVLLEREAIAARASGRNDGQLLLGLGEHYHRIHGQFGAERARLLWRFLADNHAAMLAAVRAHGIDCDLHQRGGLRLAETAHEAHELEQAAALLHAEGLPHELVAARDLPRWLPGSRGFHGALFLPGEAIVQPVQLVRGLARAAAARGAHCVLGAEVAAVTGTAGDLELRLRDGRRLRAAVAVHCTAALAPQLDRSGFLARTVFPFRGQVLASGPVLDASFPDFAMSSNFCYEYFRHSRGRFVVGGKRWSVPGEEVGIVDDATHNPQVTANLLGYVREHFPALQDVAFPHVWTGIMAGTPDGLPLCGALPGCPGEHAFLAFNGYGLSFAFLAGRCLAEQIVDGTQAHAALPLFAPRRFALA
ncbi:MAG: FAD-binding oxidoreductase [Planctomycetes bacterium]|nr:FAD-binding oxidoreductase [Planctomycetota bacterium]